MYLILGANGYLGNYFLNIILKSTSNKIVATYNTGKPTVKDSRIDWVHLDLVSNKDIDNLYDKILLYNKETLKVILLSAYHHPDKVEENPKLAWNTNVGALDYFLNKFKNNISILYYASTDSVYGESNNGYVFKEMDNCLPVNTYGRTKFMAEQLVLLYNFNVIRYSFLIGPSLSEKPHFYDNILQHLKEGSKIEMFGDSYRSPIDFYSAAKYTVDLIEKYPNMHREIINVAGDEHLSKYDVALRIAKNHNFSSFNIINTNVACAKNIFKTKRALNTLISNLKLKKLLNISSITLKGV